MKKQKTSLSFIITTLVVGLVTLFLLWSTFYFFSLYVGSMKQAAHTSSEQAVTQASNTISNYIGDMQEIMSLIEKDLTKSGGSTGQTLETLCSVRSDLVAVYIYDEQGILPEESVLLVPHKIGIRRSLVQRCGIPTRSTLKEVKSSAYSGSGKKGHFPTS